MRPPDPSTGTSPNPESFPRPGFTLPIQVPDHELIRCIGRGSYGHVWLARNIMGTYRAVKIVSRDLFRDQRPYDREMEGIRKFEPVSRAHEGFVDILHVGNHSAAECFYYIMELGDDVTDSEVNPQTYSPKTLAGEISRRKRLPFEDCLKVGITLSGALGHLHQQGFIHRDVKPTNVIFVSGVPKLADIGLVTDIDRANSYVGTEGYIPPEGPSSAQADIFSLGKVLYEMSTGKDRCEFPELPSDLDTYPDAKQLLELNEIVVKACHRDPKQRYQSAQDLQAELMLLLSGQSVRRLRHLEQRLATIRKAAGLCAVALLLGGAIYFQVYQERKQKLELRQRQMGAQNAYGTRAVEESSLLEALPYFVDALRLGPGDIHQEAAQRLRIASVLEQCPKLTHLQSLGKRVNTVQFVSDREEVLVATSDGTAQIWNLATNTLLSPVPANQHLTEAAWMSRDGTCLLTGSKDGTVGLWNAEDGRLEREFSHPGVLTSTEMNPQQDRIIASYEEGPILVWNRSDGRRLQELEGHTDGALFAGYSPDGRFIATTGKDAKARLWDAATGNQIGAPLAHKSWVYHAAFSPDGRWMVTSGFDRRARIWEIPSGREIPRHLLHDDAVRISRFSPDGQTILTASWDGSIRLWDATTTLPLKGVPVLHHSARVLNACFSPDARRIASCCIDGTVRVWDLAGRETSVTHKDGICDADGAYLLHWKEDRAIIEETRGNSAPLADFDLPRGFTPLILTRDARRVLGIVTNTAPQTPGLTHYAVFDVHLGKLVSPVFSSTGLTYRELVSSDARRVVFTEETKVTVVDTASGKVMSPPLPHEFPPELGALSPSGEWFAAANHSHTNVVLWRLRSDRPTPQVFSQNVMVEKVSFSPDDRFLLVCTADASLTPGAARIYSLQAQKWVGDPMEHGDGILHACFSQDQRLFATSGEDFLTRIWDAATHTPLSPPMRHSDRVPYIAFSVGLDWVVTTCLDRETGTGTRIWDTSGVPLTPPLGWPVKISRALFASDNRRILAETKNGDCWDWKIPQEDRPVPELINLVRLLSGDLRFGTEPQPSSRTPTWRQVWEPLRVKYPESFTASAEEIASWHRAMTKLCIDRGAWEGAGLHLKHWARVRPDDPELSGQRAILLQSNRRRPE